MTLGQQKKRVKVAIGHDHGNTETADYVIYAPELPTAGRAQPLQAISLPPGKIVQKTFPSAVAEGSKEELESLRVGTGRMAQSKAEELVISVNGGPEQFVGSLAQRQARQAFTGRGDIHRYESERSLITLLAGLGSLVAEEEIEAWVVTGLPVETFQKGKAIRRGAKDALEGDHRFVLNGGKERHARIHVVMVLMEGAGGLIAQGLDGDEVRQAILDMGGRTTDGVATEGQDPIRHLCGTLARGVEDSKEMLSRFVENDKRYKRALRAEETESILRTHIRLKAILGLLSQKMCHQPLSDLTAHQFEQVLRMQQTNAARALAEQLKITETDMRMLSQESLLHDLGLQDLEVRYRTLHARGTEILPIDLYTWTEKSLRSVGKDIASFASQLWRVGESGEVATDNALVLAAGGGAYYYLEDVRELIPEIKACERPELANAAGYANVASSALLEAMGIVV